MTAPIPEGEAHEPGRPREGARTLAGNSVAVLTANGTALVLVFGYTVVAARHLGPASFGMLALALSLQTFLDRLLNFQSWQGMIRFGAQALARGHRRELLRLVHWSYGLDAGAALLGLVAGAGLVWGLSAWSTLDRAAVWLGAVAVIGTPALATGTSVGVLRLHDRFWLAGMPMVVGGVLKLGLALFLATKASSVITFAVAAVCADFLAAVLIHAAAAWVLLAEAPAAPPAGGAQPSLGFREFFRFGVASNVSGTVRLVSREGDLFVVGGLLGPAAAGGYKLAKQIASVPLLLSDSMYHAVYPFLSRLAAEGREGELRRFLHRAVGWASLGAVVMLLAFVLLGAWPLSLLLGPDFKSVHGVASWYMVSVAVAAGTFPLQPAMLATGQARAVLGILLTATVLYFLVLPAGALLGGVSGAAIAYLAFYGPWVFLTVRTLRLRQQI